MPPSYADYRITSPAAGADAGSGPAWVAEPPSRLGRDGAVVVVDLGPLDEAGWAVLGHRLEELASIRSPRLPALIEAGREPRGGQSTAWASRDHPGARPVASASVAPGLAMRAIATAARAAHELHEAGWAHGDIRPGTVLLDGEEGLLDLPLAAAAALPPAVTRVVAPEDLDGAEPDRLWGAGATRASDIYALGALLHRQLTGTLLHPDLPRDPVVTAVQRVLVERPRVDASLSGPAGDLVRECLEPDPARRPATALAVAERLEQMAPA